MKKKVLLIDAALVLALVLTACGGETVKQTVDSLNQVPQETELAEETTLPKHTISGTILRNGAETAVYLEISDMEINFWGSASGGQLLAVAQYPESISGAADALTDCDYTDLDEDGNSDLTANFTFADGSTASLVWFYTDSGFVYNEEFSRFPGDVPALGNEK